VSAYSKPVSIAAAPDTRHTERTARDALVRNVGVDVIARVGYLVTRVLIPPFVLSRIGLEAYSLWAALFMFISYAGATAVGVSAAYVKYVADYIARGEAPKANALLSTGFMMVTAVSLVLFGLLTLGVSRVLLWLNVPPHLHHDARIVVLLVGITFLFDFSFSMFRESLSGAQKVAEVQVVWVASYLVETGLIVYLVGTGHGVVGLAEAFLVRIIVSVSLSALLAYWLLPWLHISVWSFSRQSLSQLLNFGGMVQLVSFLAIALNTVERAIAMPLVGLSAVGLLDISDKLPGMAATIPTALATSLFPAAAYLQGGFVNTPREHEVILRLYLRGARYMNLAASSIAGLLATASAPLMAVWMGRVYPGTAYLMAIFALQQHIHVMTGPGTAILRGIGRPREELFYSVPNIIAVLVTMPLSYLILGKWTTVGLGTAVVVATAVSAIGFIVYTNKLLDVPRTRFLRYVILPGTVPYMVGLIFAAPAGLATHVSRWHGAGIVAVVGVLYAATLLIAIDRLVLDADERHWFWTVVRRECNRVRLLVVSGHSI